ncbi:DUF4836 family protein [Capnocytophaga granulosa]|uniref:DUF4836 family protein n=1 Tax=Capnocytophaga granulosa TaxID=45242 RepID=UPI0028D07972|nr:DUF4836 family protein [Capnocytophaga granulosa]
MKRFLLGLVLILVASCSKKPASLALIPSDAAWVVSIDFKSLYQKADIGSSEEAAEFKQWVDSLSITDKQRDFLRELLRNPRNSGVRFREPIYFFQYGQQGGNGMENYIGMACSLSDKEKFEKTLNQLFALSNKKNTPTEESGYKLLNMAEGKYTLSWDDDKALFLGVGDADEEPASELQIPLKAKQLRSLEAKKQITSLDGFADFLSDQKDISVWVNITDVYETLDKRVPSASALSPSLFNLQQGSYLYATLEFEKEEIILSARTLYNEKYQKLLDKYRIGDASFNKKLLKHFPEKMPMAFTGAVNVKHYYEFLKEAEPELVKEADIKQWLAKKDLQLDNLLNLFGGSFVVALEDFETGMSIPIPVVGASFDVNDKKILDKIVAEEGAFTKEGDRYSLTFFFVSIHFAYNDKAFFISNSSDEVDAFIAGKHKDNAYSSSLASQAGKNTFYGFFNLNLDDYPSIIRMAMKSDKSVRDEASFQWFIDHSKDLEVKANAKENTASLIYHMKNVERNSLYSFLKFAKQVNASKAAKGDNAKEDEAYEDDEPYEEEAYGEDEVIEEGGTTEKGEK